MQYLLRFLWFLVRNVFFLSIVAIIITISFFAAMDMANIYVLLGDGLEKRTSTVLVKDDTAELSKFYTQDFIDNDNILKSNRYTDYVIRSFDHKVSVEWLWVWPWEKQASATIVERVANIDGELPQEKKTEEQKAEKSKILPPKWENAKYKVRLKKIDTSWKIDDVVMIETVEDKPVATAKQTTAPSE